MQFLRSRTYIGIILVITVIVAVRSFVFDNSVRGNGDIITESRMIGNINSLTHQMQGDVFVTIGETSSLQIQTDSNLMEHIFTNDVDGMLILRNEQLIRPSDDITFRLTVPTLNAITASGSGDINLPKLTIDGAFELRDSSSSDITMGSLTADTLTMNISGSGSVEIEGLTVSNLNSEQTGSGNIGIDTGTVDTAEISITGSGDFDGRDVTASTANVRLTGSGNAELSVTDTLEARLSGSGDLTYYGQPQVSQQSTTGSGSITQRNND